MVVLHLCTRLSWILCQAKGAAGFAGKLKILCCKKLLKLAHSVHAIERALGRAAAAEAAW